MWCVLLVLTSLHLVHTAADDDNVKYNPTSPFLSSCFTLTFIYINIYGFLHDVRTSFTIIEINLFVTKYPFLMDSPKPLQPLNSQNPLGVTKNFLLMLPHLTRLPNIAAKTTPPLWEICLVTLDNSTYLNHQTIIYSLFLFLLC